MRFFTFLLISTLLLSSCNLDNDEINCVLSNPVPEVFLIELVDADGNNLIENGTFNAEDITVTVDAETVGNGQFIPNVITIFENGGDLRNDSDYLITLAQGVQDVLRLNFTTGVDPNCGFTIYTATSATYNGTEQNILESFTGGESISVVRQ